MSITDPVPQVAADLTRTLMVFGGTSLLGGGLLTLASDRPGRVAFGQQNAMWGAINLAIAGVGAWRAKAHPAQAPRLRRTLLVNAGLDVGYIAAGAHMVAHGTSLGGRLTPDQARGHGAAVVVQGLGLLALDLSYARRLGG